MGKGSSRLRRLNLQHRMMLLFAGIILVLLANVLAFLHLRVTDEMRNQVYVELARTQTLFENVHRMRGEDLLSQAMIFASSIRLRNAVAAQSRSRVPTVVLDYATMLVSVDAVQVSGRSGKPLASWVRPGIGAPHSSFRDGVRLALAGRSGFGMDVSTRGIYQTAYVPIYLHEDRRPVGALVLGIPTDRRLADRLRRISGADITFFAGLYDEGTDTTRSVLIASTLGENESRLQSGLTAIGRNPLDVPSEGLDPPYVVSMAGVDYISVTAPIRGESRKTVAAYVIQRPLHEELRLVDRMQRTLVVVGLVAVLATLLVSYLLANGVAHRIVGVVRAAEALSQGDWSKRVPTEGPDDLRVLAEAFNRMASRLQGWDAELRAEVALRTEELNQALSRLDANLRQMRQFHADASHELRTPLTIMRGEVEVALRTVRTPEEYQRVLNSILEEMNRVSSITDHLLLLARADSGHIQVERQPIEINDILEDLHPQVLLLAERRGISLDLEEDACVSVLGDSSRLRQLFLNLIDNAIKYTPGGGSILVRVREEDGYAVVAVEDTGIGIAPADIPHVFDRFFRADRARSREMGGAGLGLAICRWVTDAHHGWVDVESVLGAGSTFTVRIPLAADEASNGTAEGDPPAAGSGTGMHAVH